MRPRDALRVHRPAAGANPLRAGRELLLTFAFRCNFACRFCYVEDGLGGRFRGVTVDEAARLLADPRLTDGVTRIVLSGGEVTLDRDLPRYVALARAVPTVEHVRIQTNASRLGEPGIAAALVAAGIDEFFVSLHGATAATCDAITGVDASLALITAGLDAIAATGAAIVTNTVVCAANLAELPAIVELAAGHGAQAAELWGYVPRVDADDQRAQLVRVTDAAPVLQRAVATGLRRGLAMTVKYFPRCLLGEVAHVHSDAQPRLVIDDAFWQDYPTYGCLYEGVCAAANQDDGCSGLADAYVRRFGWEEAALIPVVDERTQPTPPVARYHDWADRPAAAPAPAPRPLDPAVLGLAPDAVLGGHRLVDASLGDGTDGPVARLRFADDHGVVTVELHPHVPTRACFARTRSLDLTHPVLDDGAVARGRPLLAAIAGHLRAHDDDGGLAGRLTTAPRAPATAPGTPVQLPAAWPGVERPGAAAILAAAARWVTTPALVEPSLALDGEDQLRLLLNPSPHPERRAAAAGLLAAAGAPRWLTDAARAWLSEPRRTALVGVVVDAAVRVKLYLDTPTAADRAAAVALLGGPSPAATVRTIAVDVVDRDRRTFKHYAPLAAAEARARFDGPLIALLETRGLLLGELPLLAARRFDHAGAPLDAALHVDVTRFPELGLGPAWAHASGAPAAAARLASCGRATRVVSETIGTPRGRHVYLAGGR